MKSLADELTGSILSDERFISILQSAEQISAQRFLNATTESLSPEDYTELMRYADILSHSSNPAARNIAYKIVALLSEETAKSHPEFKMLAEAILSKLGNFPALKHLSSKFDGEVLLPIEREAEVAIKQVTQKTHNGKLIFTDSQFKIRKQLTEYDFFSFSGPTSIGKSFIIKDYIQTLLESPEMQNGCMVILVPTRALIGQVVKDLREEINDKTVNIAAFPSKSLYTQRKYKRTIYVFTPERLLTYAANNTVKVKYLFVDEAQKLVSLKDSRSSLYYHAIYETIRKFATKLVFASPNILNPDIFLSIFEKDKLGTLSIKDQTVSQNRYFLDLITNHAFLFPDSISGSKIEITNYAVPADTNKLIISLGRDVNNLIYCNGTAETVRRARDFAKTLPAVEKNKELKKLLKFIKEYVHKDYFLIECLEKGVAFHHGRMPQQVRRMVEEYFIDKGSPLKYMFCTSTLLEGVNLPARNIFVLNDYHGGHKFRKLDFENLIGRAGRLTKEFSGNVICVRDSATRWGSDADLLKQSQPSNVESFLIDQSKSKKREFNNIAKALNNKPFATGLTKDEEENFNHYASIMLLHHIENEGSALKLGFLEKNKDAMVLLQRAKKNNNVPGEILRVSSTIHPRYQNLALKYIANLGESAVLPPINEDTNFISVLERMYELYNWEKEESGGRNPLIPKALITAGYGKSRLGYWGMLMKHWINSEPFSQLVVYTNFYYKNKGVIWFIEDGKPVSENYSGNPKQINIIIEQLMADIENGLRFRIEKYLLNYYLLCRFQLPELPGQNWAEQVEYGTSNKQSIELQDVGFSRSAASFLLKEYKKFLVFDADSSLISIDEENLLAKISADSDHYEEIKEILC